MPSSAIPTTVIGLMTLIISTLSFVVVRLYKDNKELQGKYDMEKDARRDDVVEYNNKIVPVMSNFAQTAQLIYDKLKISKEA